MSHTVTYHRPGDEAHGMKPGDFILVHSYGRFAPRLIGFGQKLHHPPGVAYWTHAALYVGEGDRYALNDRGEYRLDGTAPMLIEAKGRFPVRRVPLTQYKPRDYAVVHLNASARERRNAVEYAESQLGHGYDYLGVLTMACWSLFGGRVTVGVSGEKFCSGLVATALMYEGQFFQGDAATQMPADLAAQYGVLR